MRSSKGPSWRSLQASRTVRAPPPFSSARFRLQSTAARSGGSCAGLAAEERAREAEDDEIAGALNRYVQKLQASLALLHSDDTAFD